MVAEGRELVLQKQDVPRICSGGSGDDLASRALLGLSGVTPSQTTASAAPQTAASHTQSFGELGTVCASRKLFMGSGARLILT